MVARLVPRGASVPRYRCGCVLRPRLGSSARPADADAGVGRPLGACGAIAGRCARVERCSSEFSVPGYGGAPAPLTRRGCLLRLCGACAPDVLGFRADDTPITAGCVGMTRVDANVVRTKCAAIRRNIARVRGLVSLPDEQFWSDERNIETVKLWLIQLVQDAADLCNHLSVRLLNKPPESYPECFELLQDAQLLDATLAQNLRRMARFRNLIVHRYWDVDDRRVLEVARNSLSDLEAFLNAIAQATGIT
ncbi:MAG: DUF86 domain-containing protein [Armatimonadetes bacterium]|nr:MAG: DUF86 domain-containing protein [Armatimonadota bacterium]